MKRIILLVISIISTSLMAYPTPKRKEIYHCVNFNDSQHVDELVIYQSKLGNSKEFFEVEVFVNKYGEEFSYIKKVNFRPKYNGKIQEFTTGNFRVKIDHVKPSVYGQLWSFARIPQYKIHSLEWSCKESEAF